MQTVEETLLDKAKAGYYISPRRKKYVSIENEENWRLPLPERILSVLPEKKEDAMERILVELQKMRGFDYEGFRWLTLECRRLTLARVLIEGVPADGDADLWDLESFTLAGALAFRDLEKMRTGILPPCGGE